jgi:hypothetical protein
MERVDWHGDWKNKIIASALLLGGMVITIVMSWIASPDPFFDVIVRSIPVVLMFTVLVIVTFNGASTPSRVLTSLFFLVSSAFFVFFSSEPEWSVPYIIIGLMIIVDISITMTGCKSPMVSNANDNFLVIVSLFLAGFFIGLFFEFLNDTILHLWILNPMSFYPMVEMFGVNAMVMITWAFVGILLYEFSLLIGIVIKIARGDKANACTI